MKSIKNKVIFSFLVFTILISSTLASALDVNLTEPNNPKKGNEVKFTINIDLNVGERFLYEKGDFVIRHTDLIFTGPNGFEETCRIKDGEIQDCELNLNFDKEYTDGKLTYDIGWDTPSNIKKGTYDVTAKVYSSSNFENYGYNTCEVLIGRYHAWFNFQKGQEDYDPELDLNEDGVVDISDVALFSSGEYGNSGKLFGRFQGFFRLISNYDSMLNGLDLYEDGVIDLSDIIILSQNIWGEYNEVQDFNGDGVIDISDVIIYSQNIYDQEWCTERLEIMDGISIEVESDEQEFRIRSDSGNDDDEPRYFYSNEVLTQREEMVEDETITKVSDAVPSLDDMWIVVFYLIGIVLAVGGIVILSKKL